MEPRLLLDPDVVVVVVDGTTVAYVPGRQELLALSPDATSVLAAVTAGDPSLLPRSTGSTVADQLLELGVLHEQGVDLPPVD